MKETLWEKPFDAWFTVPREFMITDIENEGHTKFGL